MTATPNMTESRPEGETLEEELDRRLEEKLASGDPMMLETLTSYSFAYLRDRLNEQKKRQALGGALPDSCTLEPVLLRKILRIFEESQQRLTRSTANARTLEHLPDRFSLSVFHSAGLSLEASSTALLVARRILEEAENEPPKGSPDMKQEVALLLEYLDHPLRGSEERQEAVRAALEAVWFEGLDFAGAALRGGCSLTEAASANPYRKTPPGGKCSACLTRPCFCREPPDVKDPA